jgi:hypothetical protein
MYIRVTDFFCVCNFVYILVKNMIELTKQI